QPDSPTARPASQLRQTWLPWPSSETPLWQRQVVRQFMREDPFEVALRQCVEAPVGQGDRAADRGRRGRFPGCG
ncbi:MAG: hypothetical protein QOG10_7182, partial [Kribbellaceae bacterium]|nr:hypothetical protein [Kribbellaceae bacterium]